MPEAKSASTKKSLAKTTTHKQSQSKSTQTPKKKTPAKTHSANANKPQIQSFKACEEQSKFLEFKLTKQTVYWAVISAMILGLGLWIFKVQHDVYAIYDQIDLAIEQDSVSNLEAIRAESDNK